MDGELDAGHAREVEDHLAGCSHCAAQVAAYREMSKSVARAGLGYTAPPALRRRIEATLPEVRAPNRRAVLKGFAMGSAVSAIGAIVYRRRLHVINLFVAQTASTEHRPARTESFQGFNIRSWSEGGLHYWAVSDLAADELAEFGEKFGAAMRSGTTG